MKPREGGISSREIIQAQNRSDKTRLEWSRVVDIIQDTFFSLLGSTIALLWVESTIHAETR